MTLRVAVSVVLCAAFAPVALAQGPTGGIVRGGEGRIVKPNDATTRIEQNSQNLALDWQTFNVAHGHTVEFVQPNSQATALNRIHDQNASQIFGAIVANGNVFLLNPNGIVFGETGSVNVNSLFATTLDVSADDFMAGNWDFQQAAGGSDGMVINRGLIQAARAGSVTLVAGAVSNEGVILADYGQVTLAGATRTYVDFDGDGLLRFEVSGEIQANPNGVDAAVANSGTIQANGGQVLLTAQAVDAIFRSAVNHEGVISATRIERQGGVVRLGGGSGTTMVAGTIDASSADSVGGTVEITGDRVGLMDGATIDASGATGGGQVNVGGGFQGNDENIQNATVTYVAETATINADATDNGDGGEVIVWADDTTRFFGTISARGGDNGGDGGFVEVSGKRHLQYAGTTDTRAPMGETGTLLLDPTDLDIVAGSVFDNIIGTGEIPDPFEPLDPNLTTQIGWVEINAALDLAHVVITTVGSPVSGTETGVITVVDGGTMNSGNSLTLEAADDIVVSVGADIVNLGAGDLFFDAQGNVVINAAITLTGGSFSSSGVDFTTSGAGIITTGGGNVALGHSGEVTIGANVITDGGSFTSVTGTDFDSSAAIINTSSATSSGGAVDIGAGTTTLVGGVDTRSTWANAAGDAGDIQISGGTITLSGDLTATSTDGAGGAVDLIGPVSLAGPVTINTTGITDGPVTFQSFLDGAQDLIIQAGSAAVGFQALVGNTTPLNSLVVGTTGLVTLGDSVFTTLDLTLASAGSVTISVPVTLSTATGEITVGDLSGAGLDLSIANAATSAGAYFGSIDLGAGELILSGVTDGVITVGGTFSAGAITTGTGTYSIAFEGIGQVTGLTATQFLNDGSLSIGASFAFEAGLITSGGPPLTITADATLSTLSGSTLNLGSIVIQNGVTLTLGDGTDTIIQTQAIDGVLGGASSSLVINTLDAVTIGGSIGTDIGSVSITASTASLQAVTTSGAQNYLGVTTTTLNGTLTVDTAGAGVSAGAVTLAAGGGTIALTGTDAANDVTLGTVDGTQALNITAGGGDIVLGVVGGGTPLTTVTLVGNTASLQAVTTSGAQNYTGVANTSLNGTLLVNTGGAGVSAGAVTLAAGGGTITLTGSNPANDVTLGTVNGAQALNITAGGGDIVLGVVGGTTPLTTVTLASNTASLQALTTSGAQNYNGVTTTTLNGTLTVNTAGAGVNAGAVMLAAGGGTITLTGTNAANDVTLGAVNGAQALVITALGGDVILNAGAGGSTPLSSITISANTAILPGVTTDGAQNYTGVTTTTLSGTLNVNVAGAGVSAGNVSLAGVSGNILLTGNHADNDVTLGAVNGGFTLNIVAADGDIVLGVVGGTLPLTGVTLTANTASLQAVTTSGAQNYTGVTTTTLNGTLTVNTAGAGVNAGAVTLAAGGGTILLTGTNAANDVTLGTVNGAQTLNITAGGGDVVLGIVGGTTPLAAVTINNAVGVTLNAVTVTGALTLTGGTGHTQLLGNVNAGSVDMTTARSLLVLGDITTAGGNIDLTAAGSISGANYVGITIDGAALDAAGGDITLTGAGGDTSDGNFGITLANGASVTTSGTGAIVFDGTGGAGGDTNHGVYIDATSSVAATAAATIDIDGAGGGLGNTNNGVVLFGDVSGVDGAITVAGVGSAGAASNTGIVLNGTVTASGAATITIDGTGGTGGTGVFIDGGSLSNAAALTIIAVGQVVNYGLNTLGTVAIGNGGAGDITITVGTGDIVMNAGTTISGTGALLLQPFTDGTSIGIGAGATGDFNLSDVELGMIADGFASITIGRATGIHVIQIGTATFNDPVSVRTTGAGTITLVGALSSAGTAITLDGDLFVNGARTVDTGGGSFSVTGTTDGANAAGPDHLTVNAGAGTVTFTGELGGNAPTTTLNGLTVNTTGTLHLPDTTVSGGNVTHTDGPTNLTGTAYENTGGGFFFAGITLSGATSIQTDAIRTISLGAITGGAHNLDLDAGFVSLVGASSSLGSLEVTAGTLTTLATSITTTGTQVYNGATDISGTTSSTRTLTASAVTFNGALNDATAGGRSLAIIGDAVFNDVVGGGANPLTNLSVTGDTTIAADITTLGTQTYGELVTLTATPITLTGTTVRLNGGLTTTGDVTIDGATLIGANSTFAANLVTFNGDVDGVDGDETLVINGATRLGAALVTFDLATVTFNGTLNATTAGVEGAAITGDAVFGAAVGGTAALASISVGGNVSNTASFNIATVGAQTYGGDITLGGTLNLQSTGVGAISVTGDVIASGAGFTFGIFNSNGDSTIGGSVGSGTPVASFQMTSTGGTSYLGGDVTATGFIQFNSSLVLTGDAIIATGASGIYFQGTVDSDGTPRNLTVDMTGAAEVAFTQNVGSSSPLGSLTASSVGQLTISGNVTTTGDQDYLTPTRLNGAGTRTLTGATVTFASTLISLTTGQSALSIVGDAVFGGIVGTGAGGSPASITVSGTTSIAANVTTTGVQTYTDLVTLTGPATLTGSTVTLSGGLTGDDNLIITNAAVLGGDIDTGTGDQTYNGTVLLSGGDWTLTGGLVTFNGVVTGGGNDLAIDGDLDLNAAINGVANLSVTGAVDLGVDVSTTGNQTYTGAATLSGGDRTLTSTGGVVNFASTLGGGGNGLTVAGDFDLDGAATDLAFLSVSGTAALGANVSTIGAAGQLYTGAVTLTGPVTLTGNGGDIVFMSTVDSDGTARALNISFPTGNTVEFRDDVGAGSALASLNVTDSSGGNALAAIYGDIVTTGAQNYDIPIELRGAAGVRTLTGSLVTVRLVNAETAGTQGLAITNDARLFHEMGTTNALASLEIGGNAEINDNIYVGDVVLVAGTAQFGSITGANGDDVLVIDADATVNGAVSALGALTVTGTLAFTGGTITVDGAVTFGGDVTADALSISAAQLNLGAGVDLDTSAADGNISLFVDGLALAGTNTINAGTGTFQITPRTTTHTIEFGATDTGLATNVYYASGFTGITAGQFIVGDAAHTGSIFVGAATLPSALTVRNGGAGTVTLFGNIVTAGGAVTIDSDLIVDGGRAINTTSTVPAGAAIHVTGLIDGVDAAGNTLSLTAGAADITLDGEIGGHATNTLDQFGLTTTGMVYLPDTTVAGASGVLNRNPGGQTTLTGTTYAGGQVWLSEVILTDDTTITSTTGYIVISGGLDGAGFDLDLDAQAMNISFQDVGTIHDVGTLTVSAATLTNISVNISATTMEFTGPAQVNGSRTLTGDVTFNGTLNANGSSSLAVVGDAVFSGAVGGVNPLLTLSISGATTLGADVTTDNGQTYTGLVTLAGGNRVLDDGFLVSLAGGVDGATFGLTVADALSLGGAASNLAFLTVNGAAALNGGSITTNNGAVTFNGAVTLGANTTINTGAGAGNVVFNGTLGHDGTARTLGITAGAGNVSFLGAVGGGTPATALGALTITSANNVIINSVALRAASISITHAGQLQTPGSGSSLLTDGGAVTIAGNVWLNNSLTIDTETGNDGAAGAVTITGTVDGDGGTNDTLTIDARGTTDGAVTLANIGAGGNIHSVNIYGGAIHLEQVRANSGEVGTGISVTGSGGIRLDNFLYTLANSAGADQIVFNGDVIIAGAVLIDAPTADAGDAVVFNGTVTGLVGTEQLVVQGNTLLAANGEFTNLGALTLDGTVNGDVAGRTLTIDITGILTFTGAAGTVGTPLGAFTVVGNATEVHLGDVTAQGAITIGSALNPIPVIDVGTLTTTGAPSGNLLLQGGGITIGGADVGAHNIALYGDGLDTVIASAINSTGSITISAPRDVIIGAAVSSTGDIQVTADTSANGVGGVSVTATGSLDADGAIVISGSDFTNEGANAAGQPGIVLDGDVSAGTTLTLTSAGSILQSGGTLTAATLTGSAATGASLGQTNAVTNLGAFTTDGAFTLTNGFTLVVTGAVDAGSGLASLATTAGGITVSSTGSVAGTGVTLDAAGGSGIQLAGDIDGGAGTVTLNSGSFIQQTDGVITAGELTGSVVAGTNLGEANLIATLGNLTTTSLYLINDADLDVTGAVVSSGLEGVIQVAGNLTVSGSVDGQGVRLVAMGAGNDLLLQGAIEGNGGDVILSAMGGSISQTAAGTVTTTGALEVYAGGTVVLDQGNTIGSLAFAGSVGGFTLNTLGGLVLTGNVTDPTGTVTLTTTGAITQTGGIITANTLTGSATGAATFGQANAITNLGAFATNGAFTLVDTGGLNVTGAVSTSGSGLASITTDAGNLAITTGSVAGDGVHLETTTSGNIALGGNVNSGGGTGDVTLVAAGNISQSGGQIDSGGRLTGSAGGTASLTSTTNSASLGAFTSDGGFTYVNAGGLLVDGAVTDASGLISLTTDSGGLWIDASVTGVGITLTATTAGSFIELNDDVNGGTGTVTLAAAGAITQLGGTLTAGTLTGSALSTVSLTQATNAITNLGAFSSVGGFTLVDVGGLTLTGNLSDPAGTVSITTTGALTQTGGIITADVLTGSTTGSASFTQANAITELGAFTSVGGFTLNDVGGLTLTGNLSDPTGTVSITTTGALTQTGGIITAQTLTGSATGAASLAQANVLTNLGAFTSNGALTINDANGGLNITGNVASGAGPMSITTAGGALSIGANLNAAGQTLTLTGVGVTQTAGTISAAATTVNAGAGNIALTGAGNDFTGAVTLNSTGGSVAIVDTNALTLAAPTLGANTAFSAIAGTTLTLPAGYNFSTGTGAVDLRSNGGVLVTAGNITTTSGNISLTGTGGIQLGHALTTGSGTISLNSNLVLTADTVINAGTGALVFAGTVNSDGTPRTLAVTAANTTFGGAVGLVSALQSLTTTGAVAINGGAVETVAGQTYNNAVTLGGATTLEASVVNFVSTVGGATRALTITGDLDLDGAATLASLSVSGASDLSANVTTAGGTQSYADTVTLTGNRTLTAATVEFQSAVNGSANLTVNGAVTLGANVTTAGTQTYNGAATLTGNRTLVGTTVNFGSTLAGGGNALIITGNFDLDDAATGLTTLTVSGASDLAANVTSTGNQTYNDTVALTGNRTLAANTVVFNGDVNGTGNLTVDGAVTLGANVTTAGTQTYTGVAMLTGNRALTGTTVNFGSTVGGATRALTITGNLDLDGAATLASLSVSGASDLAANVTTTGGNQTYSGTVALSGNRTLAANTVAFNGDVNGSANLTVNGAVTLGANVTTVGMQTYTGAANLTGNRTLVGTTVNFGSTVTGGTRALTITGNLDLDGTATLASLSVSGTSALAADVTTSGNQSYTGAVTLTGARTLTSGATIAFASDVTGTQTVTASTIQTAGTHSGAAITMNGPVVMNANTTFSGDVIDLDSVSGGRVLTLVSIGTVTLDGTVDVGSVALGGLTGAVVLGGATTITTANTAVDFSTASGINGANALVINAGNAPITLPTTGTGTALTAITLTGGSLDLRAVRTTGAQTYTGTTVLRGNLTTSAGGGHIRFNSPVTLAADLTIGAPAAGSDITFMSTINGARNLTVDAGSGDVNFNAQVGGATPLSSLTVVGGNASIHVTSGAVTTGIQEYTGRAVINGELIASAIIFNGVVQLDAANTAILISDTVDFNGGAGSVIGSGALSIVPATQDATIDIGGTSGTLNLSGAAFDGFDGVLTIGAVDTDNTTPIIAGAITINDAITLSASGALYLLANSGDIVLANGVVEAGTLVMVAAGGSILNTAGEAGIFRADSFLMVAADAIGDGIGQELNVEKLSGGGAPAPLETALGGEQSFIEDDGTVSILTTAQAPNARTIAQLRNIQTNDDATNTNAGQAAASREQGGGVSESGAIDPSLFEQISLWAVEQGLLLPRDQREDYEELDECEPDEVDCEEVLTRALSSPGQVAVVAGCCSV